MKKLTTGLLALLLSSLTLVGGVLTSETAVAGKSTATYLTTQEKPQEELQDDTDVLVAPPVVSDIFEDDGTEPVPASESELLVASWQEKLNTTGRLHIPFDPEAPTVSIVGKSGITATVRYNVEHSLHITPDFDYEISADPRVEIVFSGGENTAFINYDKKVTNSPWTGRLYVHDLSVKATGADWMSVIRTKEFKMEFNKPIFQRCTFFATGYAFDFKNVNYTVVPVFRDIMTGGGGALRYTSTGGGQNGFHSTSQMEITSWMHNGNNRVGPAFDLRGTAGLVATNIIDEQKAELHPKLKAAGWTGPLSIRISSPYFPVYITNYWNEWWGDMQKMAPGCWAAEFRSESRYGDGKKEIIVLQNFMTGGGSTITKPALRIVGGSDGKLHPLYVVLLDAWKPTPDKYGVYGRAALKLERPILNGHKDVALKVLRDIMATPNLYVEDAMTAERDVLFLNEINTLPKETKDWETYPVTPYYEEFLENYVPEPEVDPIDDGTDEGTDTPSIIDGFTGGFSMRLNASPPAKDAASERALRELMSEINPGGGL